MFADWHFEDRCSIDHTPIVERLNTGCKPIFEALNVCVSGPILENNQLYGKRLRVFQNWSFSCLRNYKL